MVLRNTMQTELTRSCEAKSKRWKPRCF